MIIPVPAETVVHRIGGAAMDNLRLKRAEQKLVPPGVSVLFGGTAEQAMEDMKSAYPNAAKWAGELAVGTSTVATVRSVGFEVWPCPNSMFANHARIVHPEGIPGFTDEYLSHLASVFAES